jgi:hypothetical protein
MLKWLVYQVSVCLTCNSYIQNLRDLMQGRTFSHVLAIGAKAYVPDVAFICGGGKSGYVGDADDSVGVRVLVVACNGS